MRRRIIYIYTTLTNFGIKYIIRYKVYTDVGGIKYYTIVLPPVREIMHLLKLADYLHVQADKPWCNYYVNWLEFWLLCFIHSGLRIASIESKDLRRFSRADKINV